MSSDDSGVRADPHVAVRPARADDWRAVRDIRLRALKSDPDCFARSHAEESAMDDAFWIGRAAQNAPMQTSACFVAGRIDGSGVPLPPFVALTVSVCDEQHSHLAWLFSMWVEPAHRGRGLARELIDRVCVWAHSKGRTELRLVVDGHNTKARRVYRRTGFREVEPLPGGPTNNPRCDVEMSRDTARAQPPSGPPAQPPAIAPGDPTITT
jgi:ribosomal protein S18 acetylase RimI-like enzyme